MYISEIYIENFRIFGTEKDEKHLHCRLGPGLNVLAGENDSGKSAVVDAIRHLLWTTSREVHWLIEDDFHVEGSERALNLTIRCVFRDLSTREQARFAEFLSIENEQPCLYVTLKATRLVGKGQTIRSHMYVTRRSGKNGDGPAVEGEIRDFLRATYLRPLRDAEGELSGGRGSRLAQILGARPESDAQGKCEIDPGDDACEPKTLVEIMRRAEVLIENNEFIRQAQSDLNKDYLGDFSIGQDKLEGEIGVARQAELRQILEKLELWLSPMEGVEQRTPRGLGVNNVLFMATELLLLSEDEYTLRLLLIEEPEAHLHPQMQFRLMDFLEDKAKQKNVQIIVTTHSPNLASRVNLESIILMCGGKVYPLRADVTRLEKADYLFLRRFLDVTKANLFFAKGVAIVEGDAENILVPTLAKLLDKSFPDYGISIVKVGSSGLFRYSRILQRQDDTIIPIRVACIADRDIVPDSATKHMDIGKRKVESGFEPGEIDEKIDRIKRNDGGSVKTFVSPRWTLEYDLAISGLGIQIHTAVKLAERVRSVGSLSDEEKESTTQAAATEYEQWEKDGLDQAEIAAKIYEPLYERRASKAETAQFLAEYLESNPPSPADIRAALPGYLVEAIDYVTGQENDSGG